jgi:excisionase family DNA binding protein
MSSAEVSPPPALLTVRQVAALLNCSSRHVCRLSDRGVMPRPAKLGDMLVRWNRAEIEQWIADGCKPVRAAGKGVRA